MKFTIFNFQFSIFRKGFSLIEGVVVVGILIILAGMGFWVFRFFEKESHLNNATEEIISVLRFAQNKTLASEGASQYGVYFDNTTTPHQHTLFKGADFASRDPGLDAVNQLPESVEIYEFNLGGGTEVVFNRISGKTVQAGDLKLRLINTPLKTRTVYIESSGQVSVVSPVLPANGRIEDSRHVHFDLGWSIQNASDLKFVFIAAGQTETVPMASYFNPLKTEFDWSGTFDVLGTDQVFRVHTHFLDAFDTLLCVHRDRTEGKTDQEVIIYIVDAGFDKEIAHYLGDAADTVNVGGLGGIMEIQ